MTGLHRIGVVSVAAAAAWAGVAAAEQPNTLTAAEKAAGWELLFDGKTTEGWRGFRREAFPDKGWAVEDGTLKCVGGAGGGDIITTDQYGDFEFQIEWKATPRANSGIMYRTVELHGATWQTGPEFQVLDDFGHNLDPSHPHSAGAMYDLAAPASGKVLNPAGQWNHARIMVKDGLVRHWLNGVKVVEVRIDDDTWTDRIAGSKFKGYQGFGTQPRGHIAIQDHGDTLWFRNIKVRDLSKPMPGEVSLFNGSDMSGWTAFIPELINKGEDPMQVWSVQDGIIICSGNPVGYIRTEDDYTNYVLKLEWRFNPVTKQAGNSGVLLRQIEEDKVWPRSVEAQLHSENAGDFWNIGDFPMTTDPERTRGRNTRKLLMAENPVGQWNQYEIIVDGPTITLYVNGELVNQATDVLETPGKIALQSEGAEIHFRNIRLAPIQHAE